MNDSYSENWAVISDLFTVFSDSIIWLRHSLLPTEDVQNEVLYRF